MGSRLGHPLLGAVVAAAVPSIRDLAADQVMPVMQPHASAERSLAGAGDYFALMKPRVMSLVIFTALTGLAIAPGHVHPLIGFTALLCIAVGAGAAGALNM